MEKPYDQRLHKRPHNLYVAMDEDNDINMNDIDEDGDAVKQVDDDADVPRIMIDRENYSMSGLHRRYDYQPVEPPNPVEFVRKKVRQCSCGLETIKGFLLYVFPAFDWLPKYNLRANAIGDLMAGLIVGIVNIPQSMGFSLLAVLPPVYGLYTAFFAPLAFFLMGSSRHTSIGTFGVISILCGDAVEKILARRYPATTIDPTPSLGPITVTHGMTSSDFQPTAVLNATTPAPVPCGPICDERVQLHTTLCLMVGMIQILMAVLRLGFVTTYLAQPLVRAFTTGAACHVITSQVPPFLGLSLPRYTGPLSLVYTWRDIFINLPNVNVAAFLLGLLSILILAPGKYLSERYKEKLKIPLPWELLVVIVTILISYFVNVADRYGVDIIGDIPAGFPTPTVPSLPSGLSAFDLIGDAISIAIVAFAVSVSLAKIFATKNDYEIDSNQELLGYGASNTTSSFFLCFVAASALARVALLDGAGGKTQVSMIVSSIIIMFVLLVIGPLFEPLPRSVLGAIIIYALRGMMFQFSDLLTLSKTSLVDFSIWVVTWLSVFLLGVDLGLGVGVIYSIITVICRSQWPRYSTMGRLADSDFYQDVKNYYSAGTSSGIVIFKMQTTLYFANAQQFRQNILRKTGINPIQKLVQLRKAEAARIKESGTDSKISLEKMEISDDELHTIIIDCGHFAFIDVSGAKALAGLVRDYKRVGIAIIFCSCADSVMRSIEAIGEMDESVEDTMFFPTVHDAVMTATRQRATSTGQETTESKQDGGSTNTMDHEGETTKL